MDICILGGQVQAVSTISALQLAHQRQAASLSQSFVALA